MTSGVDEGEWPDMRAMWSGAVSFGLVSVPVRLYSATTNHDIRFHQVHGVDGGRIRYRRVCTVCEQEVDYADIVKGYETPDGELITLTEADLDSLPVNSSREIEVVEFVPADQVDPLLLDKSYYLEPETRAAKPYALLREALRETDRMAVVTVTLRQKEALAVLRVRDQVVVMQTVLWPDEVREPEFEILDAEVELRPQEMRMAASLIDSLGADFDPTRFSDTYRAAVAEVIERKRSSGDSQPTPVAAPAGPSGGDSMTDLLSALEASVAATRDAPDSGGAGTGARQQPGDTTDVPAQRSAPEADDPGTETDPGKGARSRKPAAAPKSGRTSAAKKSDGDNDHPKTTRRARKPA